jgi:hypothetical protein
MRLRRTAAITSDEAIKSLEGEFSVFFERNIKKALIIIAISVRNIHEGTSKTTMYLNDSRTKISPILNARYTPIIGAVIFPRPDNSLSSGFILKLLEANSDSKIIIGNPTAIAERRNNNGKIGVCHRGAFLTAITINVPNED